MLDKPGGRRRNHFIKKGFQINFSIRFLALIIIEAVLLAGLFWYMSSNTLTTGYIGSQLRIDNTSSFFFPSLIISGLIVIGIVAMIGILGLIFISHKIAGPLYRFEESLKEISNGDLSHRIRTRKNDQLTDLADTLNHFTSTVERKVVDMKLNMQEITNLMAKIQPHLSSDDKENDPEIKQLLQELSRKLNYLKGVTDEFKTSQDNIKDNDSKCQEA